MNDDWTKGMDLYRAERFEEAIPYLERAAHMPDDEGGAAVRGPALNHLAMAQYSLGRFEDAVPTFRAAILQSPGKGRLHYNLGNSLLAVGRTADARRQYEIALTLEPDYAEAQQALVVVAAELGKTTAAPEPEPPAPAVAEKPAPEPPRAQASPEPAPRSEPAPEAAPAATDPLAPADPAATRRRMEELEEQLRDARQAMLQTRALLDQQEQTVNALTEALLSTVRAYTTQQEAAIQEAALRHAQNLLSAAATRRI